MSRDCAAPRRQSANTAAADPAVGPRRQPLHAAAGSSRWEPAPSRRAAQPLIDSARRVASLTPEQLRWGFEMAGALLVVSLDLSLPHDLHLSVMLDTLSSLWCTSGDNKGYFYISEATTLISFKRGIAQRGAASQQGRGSVSTSHSR